MRRTEQRALEARPYAARLSILMGLVADDSRSRNGQPDGERQEAGQSLVVHMATDKGLCGGLNAHVNHSLGAFILEQTQPVVVITVGRKARDFALRSRLRLAAEFSDLGDAPGIAELRPLCGLITGMFSRGEVDRVYLSYSRYVSLTVQRPTIEELLPVVASVPVSDESQSFIYEPDIGKVVDALLVRYVEAAIYHAYLERVASEYAARMIAMHNATDSAIELAEAMTMELNKSRQTAITEEICDVSAGTEALSHGGAGG